LHGIKLLLISVLPLSSPVLKGKCLMQWAAWSGHLELLKLLLAHGGQLNRRDTFPNGGWTPFLGACHQARAPPLPFCAATGAPKKAQKPKIDACLASRDILPPETFLPVQAPS
jgi:hypothetical protein